MQNEHTWCRRHNSEIGNAVSCFDTNPDSASILLIENGRAFIELLSDHTFKEETIVYRMGDQIFSGKGQKQMIAEFVLLERRELAGSSLGHFENVIGPIEKELDLTM